MINNLSDMSVYESRAFPAADWPQSAATLIGDGWEHTTAVQGVIYARKLISGDPNVESKGWLPKTETGAS